MSPAGVNCACALALLGLSSACGAAPPREVEGFPSTAMDPPAYAPERADEARTGAAVGIDSVGGHSEARALAFRFLEAVIRQDPVALHEMMSDPLAVALPRPQPATQSRDQRIRHLLETVRNTGLPGSTDPRELVDAAAIRVERLETAVDSVPAGLRATDLLVRFPLRPDGVRFLVHFGWPVQPVAQGAIIVRSEPEPRIVGL